MWNNGWAEFLVKCTDTFFYFFYIQKKFVINNVGPDEMNKLIITYKINFCCAGLHYFSLVGSFIIAFQLVCTGGAFPRPTRLAGLSETSNDAFNSRLNYGWVAEKIMQVCVADGYVTHTYHLALPKRADVETDPHNFTLCELENLAADCQRMTGRRFGVEPYVKVETE